MFILFINVGYGLAQEKNYLDTVIKRINSLETELKNIQSNGPSENKESSNYIDAIASHEKRLVDLEEEIRGLNGNIEEIKFEINKILQSLNSIQEKNIASSDFEDNNSEILDTDIDNKKNTSNDEEKNLIISKDPNRINNPTMKVLGTVAEKEPGLESEGRNETEKQKPLKKNNKEIIEADNQSALLSKSPSEIYSYAYEMLVRENFLEAEQSFKAFIGEHPNDPLASNAYYWLGETYYVQKKFQLAAISFARGFQNFPKGNKALDQLFKLALTFMNLGKNEDACAAFSKLDSEFPNAPKRISNRAKEYIKRAKC